MTTTAEWAPPKGSVPMPEEGEGWWKAPNGDVYCDPAWEWPDTPTREQAQTRAREEAARCTRREAALVPGLMDRVVDLQVREYLALEFLKATLELLGDTWERLEFAEDLLSGVLEEHKQLAAGLQQASV
jgi:hypothetical protein